MEFSYFQEHESEQFTFFRIPSKGKVDGIEGRVDMNITYE